MKIKVTESQLRIIESHLTEVLGARWTKVRGEPGADYLFDLLKKAFEYAKKAASFAWNNKTVILGGAAAIKLYQEAISNCINPIDIITDEDLPTLIAGLEVDDLKDFLKEIAKQDIAEDVEDALDEIQEELEKAKEKAEEKAEEVEEKAEEVTGEFKKISALKKLYKIPGLTNPSPPKPFLRKEDSGNYRSKSMNDFSHSDETNTTREFIEHLRWAAAADSKTIKITSAYRNRDENINAILGGPFRHDLDKFYGSGDYFFSIYEGDGSNIKYASTRIFDYFNELVSNSIDVPLPEFLNSANRDKAGIATSMTMNEIVKDEIRIVTPYNEDATGIKDKFSDSFISKYKDNNDPLHPEDYGNHTKGYAFDVAKSGSGMTDADIKALCSEVSRNLIDPKIHKVKYFEETYGSIKHTFSVSTKEHDHWHIVVKPG